MILWTQYLELVTCNDTLNYALAKEHHSQRVSVITMVYLLQSPLSPLTRAQAVVHANVWLIKSLGNLSDAMAVTCQTWMTK